MEWGERELQAPMMVGAEADLLDEREGQGQGRWERMRSEEEGQGRWERMISRGDLLGELVLPF